MNFFFILILILLSSQNISFANSSGEIDIESEIPIRDKTYYLIQKRKKEAEDLVFEGIELKKKGYKENSEELTAEGNIKKKIGEEQLIYLKDAEIKHKNRDEVNVK